MSHSLEDEISNYPDGLVLVPRGTDDSSIVVGPHIRGSRLRASSAGYEEVDLLLPGTARYQYLHTLLISSPKPYYNILALSET